MIGYHKDEKMETIRRIKIIDVLKREDYGSECKRLGAYAPWQQICPLYRFE